MGREEIPQRSPVLTLVPSPSPPSPSPPPPLFPGGGGAAGIAERKGALNLFCNICKVGFMANCPRVQLQGHIDSKHPKNAFADAFPDFVDK
jgi:hypothetical protein